MPSFSIFSRLTRTVAAALFLSATASTAALAANDGRAYAWPEQKEDVAHILSRGRPLHPQPLDLGHEREYRYLIQQLRLAGVTPAFAPQLFATIRAERERYRQPGYREQAHAASLATMTPADTEQAGLVSAVNILTSIGVEEGPSATAGNVVTSGFSSVLGGTVQTNVTLSLYDENNHLIDQAGTTTPSGQGQFVETQAQGAASSEVVHSSLLYAYVARDGGFHSGTVYAATTDEPVTIVNDAPKYTRAGVTTGPIVACMFRNSGNKGDCDYWQPNAHEIILPVQGSMAYNNPVVMQNGVPQMGQLLFNLVHPTEGGGCVFPGLTADAFFPNATYTPNATSPTKIAWNQNPQDFGAAQACMPSGTMALFTFAMTVNINVNGTVTPVLGAITSSGASAANDNVTQIPQIDILWGCLVEGAMVETVDGPKRVEDIVAQKDRVITDRHGGSTLVTGTVHGEEEDVIRIVTESRKTILLTRNHPVMTAGLRIKLAREISIGDGVMTRDGLETVTELRRERHRGKVYNLVLEPKDEVTKAQGSLLFADGIMVGDNRMQRVFEEAYRARASTIHANAPLAWRADNENILKRQAGKE